MVWNRQVRNRCNDTERMLRSGRTAPRAEPPVRDAPLAELFEAEPEATDGPHGAVAGWLDSAHARLGDAYELLAPFRAPGVAAPRMVAAFVAVRSAREDVQAARHELTRTPRP